MAKKTISSKTRDAIIALIPGQMEYAREARDARKTHWELNEQLYYGKKRPVDAARANVMLPKMQGFVETQLSKIDELPVIRYEYTNLADYKSSKHLTSFATFQSSPEQDDWGMKDLLGKKQAVIYGRAIYEYHASSSEGYRSVLSLVDVYDFLIDPRAGGYDMEKARYLGRGNIVKTVEELWAGVKEGKYSRADVKALVGETTPESVKGDEEEEISDDEQAKENRKSSLGQKTTTPPASSSFKFWEWYMVYGGKRYYVLYNDTKSVAVRVCELKEVFESNLWPFWSWAISPSWTDFWTPGSSDAVAEIYLAQSAVINQWLDNAEARNRPMKGYDVKAVRDPALLKYGRDRLVPFKEGIDPNKAVRVFETPSLEGVDRIYNLLDQMQQLESGVTAASKGAADEDKVGIMQGNQANVSDRLQLVNKAYAHAYHRFGQLFMWGIREHMTKTTAIEILGEKGVEWKEVKKSELLPTKGKNFNITIVSSSQEQNTEVVAKKLKLDFLTARVNSQTINQKVADELSARIVGFDEAEIKRLMNTTDALDLEMAAEASRDIQRILKGDIPEPNEKANTAYLQQFVDYVREEAENLPEETEKALFGYMETLRPIITRNMVTMAAKVNAGNGTLGNMLGRDDMGGIDPETGEPFDAGQGQEEQAPA